MPRQCFDVSKGFEDSRVRGFKGKNSEAVPEISGNDMPIFGLSCHSEEWRDEESLSGVRCLGMEETLRFAQSDRRVRKLLDLV